MKYLKYIITVFLFTLNPIYADANKNNNDNMVCPPKYSMYNDFDIKDGFPRESDTGLIRVNQICDYKEKGLCLFGKFPENIDITLLNDETSETCIVKTSRNFYYKSDEVQTEFEGTFLKDYQKCLGSYSLAITGNSNKGYKVFKKKETKGVELKIFEEKGLEHIKKCEPELLRNPDFSLLEPTASIYPIKEKSLAILHFAKSKYADQAIFFINGNQYMPALRDNSNSFQIFELDNKQYLKFDYWCCHGEENGIQVFEITDSIFKPVFTDSSTSM